MISTGFVNSIKRGCRQLCGRRIYFFAMTVIPIVLAGFLLGLMRNGLPLHIPTAIVNHIVAHPAATYTDQCTPGDIMMSVIILITIAAIQQNENICNTFLPS